MRKRMVKEGEKGRWCGLVATSVKWRCCQGEMAVVKGREVDGHEASAGPAEICGPSLHSRPRPIEQMLIFEASCGLGKDTATSNTSTLDIEQQSVSRTRLTHAFRIFRQSVSSCTGPLGHPTPRLEILQDRHWLSGWRRPVRSTHARKQRLQHT